MECLGLHNKHKAEMNLGHKPTGPKEEEEEVLYSTVAAAQNGTVAGLQYSTVLAVEYNTVAAAQHGTVVAVQ
jgi:hypothetical protein